MGDPFDLAAGWLQEHLLIPLLYALGPDAVGGRVVRLGAVRGVRRLPGGDHLRGLRAAGALASGGALAGCARRDGGCALHDHLARRRAAAVHLRAVLPRAGGAERVPGRPRLGAADAGAAVAVPARPAGADLRALRDHPRLRRLLAASAVAPVRLVVGAAFAASRAAADDVLVGRPQPRAGRSDRRAVVRRDRAGDRRAAAAVPAAGAGAAVPREPVARQCAGVVRRGWASGC